LNTQTPPPPGASGAIGGQKPPLEAAWAWIYAGPHILAKVIRFACIGGLSGILFSLTTAILVSHAGIGAVQASIVGYGVSIPANFLGHRHISFRSRAEWRADAGRFALMQSINIGFTSMTMYLIVFQLRIPYYWGIIAAVILAPLVNFALANFWVFRQQAFK
jgi:putative flippase GtrA